MTSASLTSNKLPAERISGTSVLAQRLDKAMGFILSLPALIIMAVLMLYPLGYAVWLSFVQWKPKHSSFVGLDNYMRIVTDPIFWTGVGNTLFYTFWNVIFGTALSIGMALLMNRPTLLARFLRLAVFLPVIVSSAVSAISWIWLLNADNGLLNQLLELTHISKTGVPWLNSPATAKWSIVMVNIWLGTGLSSMLLLAAMQNTSRELYEAASLDGANAWHRLLDITIPAIRPTLLVVVIIKFIGSFKTFDQVFIMTGGGPLYTTETMLIYLYRQGFEYFDFGFAGAVGVVFFIIVATLSIAQAVLLKDRRR
ncbi:MAG TPA: sugar ABC transporter permease [Devosiaceae bacterium]